jgi:phosphonate transport system permease protein
MNAASLRGDPYASTRVTAYAALVIVGLGIVSAIASDVSVDALFSAGGAERVARISHGLLRPHLGAEFLLRVARLLAESIAIGALGVGLALLLGVPLALAATRLPQLSHAPDAASSGLAVLGRAAARALLAVFRSVPEIVWAYLFVRVFGLGPAPAVLAIGISFAGIIGKLYAELAESVDRVPTRWLAAAGAGRLTQLLYGVLPQVRRSWSGYALFRLECAIRSAAILGVVGAGGLGAEIELSIRYFQFDRLSTSLLALVACIVALETWSAYVRRHDRRRLDLATLGAGVAFGVVSLDAGWAALFEPAALRSAWSFVAAFSKPSVDVVFSTETLRLIGETLGMAAFGTLVAAVVAGALAPLASRALIVTGYLPASPQGRSPFAFLLHGVMLAVRGLLAALRALPELVLALLFVAWLGPGPLAGALAIAAHTIGILGRLFAEVYEDAESEPARLLESAGATRFGVWIYGLLPQATSRLLAFVLFRFEVNVRATAMVGFVGAGGIGDAIHTAISLFHMSDLAALLLLMLATVVVVDAAGDRLRHRLLA